jgi:hypothetical protein
VLVALLGTCVLWPSLQRDFLLSTAFEGRYRPVWSSRILEELEYEEARKLVKQSGLDSQAGVGWVVTSPHSDVAAELAARLITTMRSEFEDAEVPGWEPLVGTYGLPDPDDEHVLASAVIAGAGTLVTSNLSDSPGTRCPLRLTC